MNRIALFTIFIFLLACKSNPKPISKTNIDYVEYAQEFVSKLAKKQNVDNYINAILRGGQLKRIKGIVSVQR